MCEQCVTRITALDKRIIQTVEKHKQDFLTLFEKIHKDLGGSVVNLQPQTLEEHQIEQAYQELEDTESDLEPSPQLQMAGLLASAHYVLAIYVQTLLGPDTADEFGQALAAVMHEGWDDGHAIAVVNQERRH